MKNMMRMHFKGEPVKVLFPQPSKQAEWIDSIEVHGLTVPLTDMDLGHLVELIVEEWVMSEEELNHARNCPCGQSHVL